MNYLSKGKAFLKKHPNMINIISKVHNFLCLNRVKGKNKNFIKFDSAFLRGCKISIKGKENRIVIGNRCYIKGMKISIKGDNNTIILGEDNVIFNADICFEDSGGIIELGDNNMFFGPMHMAVIEGTKIYIGNDCLFSSEIVIRTGDSHSILDKKGKRINDSEDVVIGNHTWIGNRSILLKGSETPENSVVSTGAIITSKFKEPGVVIGGVPGKVIKTDINWDYNRI